MRITFAVTNELNYDQRMIRICNSLSHSGFEVKLIGVKFKNSTSLQEKNYAQKRLKVFAEKGFGFYLEYNIKLFFFLLFQKVDILCCIDLDTMLPVYCASVLKGKKRVYDAHEYFSQQKEVMTRRFIYRFWHFLEKRFIPKFPNGYTVSQGVAEAFQKHYGVNYRVIRNLPLLKPLAEKFPEEKNIIYRGSVNEGRGFEFLIPAMKNVDRKLIVYGDGNFLHQAKLLVNENGLENKVFFKGKILPRDLDRVTQDAFIGINLVEAIGDNQVLSLANKFFDYIQNGIPHVTMNFSEYKKINDEYEVALLLDELSVSSVSKAINELFGNKELHLRLRQNCLKAREVYNWQNEEKNLIDFYRQCNK